MPVALALDPAWLATGKRVPVALDVAPPLGTPGDEDGPCADDPPGTAALFLLGLCMVGY